MVKVMLQAVSKMLADAKKTTTSPEIATFYTRIGCAKVILDKVIEGLDTKPTLTKMDLEMLAAHEQSLEKEEPKPTPLRDPIKLKPLKGPVDGKYKIVKDANNKLVRIEGLDKNAKIELDGKIMTYEEAIGKEFIGGRML